MAKARTAARKAFGSVGGKKAAANMTPEERSERARAGAKARWGGVPPLSPRPDFGLVLYREGGAATWYPGLPWVVAEALLVTSGAMVGEWYGQEEPPGGRARLYQGDGGTMGRFWMVLWIRPAA